MVTIEDNTCIPICRLQWEEIKCGDIIKVSSKGSPGFYLILGIKSSEELTALYFSKDFIAPMQRSFFKKWLSNSNYIFEKVKMKVEFSAL
jgi:hypothetical protein